MAVILHDSGDGFGTSIGTPLLQRGSRPQGRRDDKRNIQPETIRRHFPTGSFARLAVYRREPAELL